MTRENSPREDQGKEDSKKMKQIVQSPGAGTSLICSVEQNSHSEAVQCGWGEQGRKLERKAGVRL